MTPADLVHQVERTATTAVQPLGLIVEDVTVIPAGRRRLVRVSVDRDLAWLPGEDRTSTVPPVSLDEIADASRAVDTALEESALMGEQPYVLEVSSAGVSRPLTQPRHFRRNVGRLVEVTTQDGPRVVGRVTAADADSVTLAVASSGRAPGAAVTLPYAALLAAVVQVEFNRPADDEEGDAAAGDDLEDPGDVDDPDSEDPDEEEH